MFRNRWLIALGAIATAFVLVSADAHARVGGGFSGGSRGMHVLAATRHPHRAYRRAHSALDHTTRQRRAQRPDWNPSGLVRRRLVWRACCRLPRRRFIWLAVRARTFRWHGGLRLNNRSAVAGRAGRDCRSADFRLVAAA